MKKNIAIIGAVIATLFVALFLVRKNPAAVTQIMNNDRALPENNAPSYSFNFPGYVPRDIPLPPVQNSGVQINRYSTCNFCIPSRLNILPAGNPAPEQMFHDSEMITVSYTNQPFGGGG